MNEYYYKNLQEASLSVSKQKLIVDGLGMINTANQTEEEKINLDAHYRIEHDKLKHLQYLYFRALKDYTG